MTGYPSIPSVAHSPTSREAAESIRGDAATTLRHAVLLYLQSRADGATDEEIAEGTAIPSGTARARRWELMLAEEIHDSGETRTTRSGRLAVVWKAGPPSCPRQRTVPCVVCRGKGRIPAPAARREAPMTQGSLFDA